MGILLLVGEGFFFNEAQGCRLGEEVGFTPATNKMLSLWIRLCALSRVCRTVTITFGFLLMFSLLRNSIRIYENIYHGYLYTCFDCLTEDHES